MIILLELQEQLQQAHRAEIGDGRQAKVLLERLAELEKEIERFRRENATLERLRKEREEVRYSDVGSLRASEARTKNTHRDFSRELQRLLHV